MLPMDSQNSLLLELLRRVDTLQQQVNQRNRYEAFPEASSQASNAFALSQRVSTKVPYSASASTKRYSLSSLEPHPENPFESYDSFFIHTGVSYVPCYVSLANGALLLRLATDSFVFSVPFATIVNIACDAIKLLDSPRLLYISRISYTDKVQSLHNYNTVTLYSPSKERSEQMVSYLVWEAKLTTCDRFSEAHSNMEPEGLAKGRSQSYSRTALPERRPQPGRFWRDNYNYMMPSQRSEGLLPHEGFFGFGGPSEYGINLQTSGLRAPVDMSQQFWPEASAVPLKYNNIFEPSSGFSGRQYETERDMGFYSFTTNASTYDRPLSQSENLRMATGTQASNLMSFSQGYNASNMVNNLISPKRNSQPQSDTASVFQQSGYANPSSQTEPSKKMDGCTERSLNSICNEYEKVIEQQNELVTNLWGIIGELNRRLEQDKSE